MPGGAGHPDGGLSACVCRCMCLLLLFTSRLFGQVRAAAMAHIRRYPTVNVSAVAAQQCINGTVWMQTLLGECVENVWEYYSVIIAIVSMLCFLFSSLPQVYEAYRNGKVEEAMSLGFLLCIFSGDTTNLVGCYLTRQLPIQIVTAVFYIFTDIILISQFMYYMIRNRNSRKTPLLKYVCFLWCVLVGCSVFLVLPRLLLGSEMSPRQENPTSPNLEVPGYVCGYLSSVFYLSSRFPQLYKNYKRRSTEGTSYLLFALAMLGNSTYGISLIVMLPGLKGSKSVFILSHLAWLIGSLGVLSLDFLISAQFVMYRKQSLRLPNQMALKIVPEVEPLLCEDEDL